MARFDMKDKKVIDGVRPETLYKTDDGFLQPSADEVREVLRLAELTGAAAGVLTGVNSRTVRKWSGGETAIPYAAWRLLCQYVGLVEPIVKA